MDKKVLELATEHLQFIVDKKIGDKIIEPENFAIVSLTNSIILKSGDIYLLMQNEQVESIEILMRTIFEQSAYLKFILQMHSKTRAEQFLYSYRIQSAEKHKSLIDSMITSGEYEEAESIKQSLKNNIKEKFPEINSIEEYIEFFKEKFRNNLTIATSKKINYEKWYNITGRVSNFRILTEEIHIDESIYKMFYNLGSMNVHGINVLGNISRSDIDKGTILSNTVDPYYVKVGISVILYEISKLTSKHFGLTKVSKSRNIIDEMHFIYTH